MPKFECRTAGNLVRGGGRYKIFQTNDTGEYDYVRFCLPGLISQKIRITLEVTDPVREMILSGAGIVEFRNKSIDLGMEPLLTNGLSKVRQGVTTIEEVLSVCPLTERS